MEEIMEDETEAETATVIVEEDHDTPLIEAEMAGIESALLVTPHTVDIVGNALVLHATNRTVVEL